MNLRGLLYPIYSKRVLPIKMRRRNRKAINMIRQRRQATVLFIVSSLPMWRCQELYDLLTLDPRFSAYIALIPFSSYSTSEREKGMNELNSYFRRQGSSFIDLSKTDNPASYIRTKLNPDIIFYPQPYQDVYGKGLDFDNFLDKLICYTPYGIITLSEHWLYNILMNNTAWRLYFPNNTDLDCAQKIALNKGKNVRVIGSTSANTFLHHTPITDWKESKTPQKKIIWAPHFSIEQDGWLHRGSFLVLNQVMIELAKKYQEQIQFAFKPHPRLLTELYKHPDWGKEKADAYYQKWANMPNTQLETGGYVDLFMTSDAMIHDCGSFTAEYHYTQNPVMFFTSDLDGVKKQLNELGLAAIDAHYIGSTAADIEHFIEHVVLKGEDPLKSARKEVFDKYLLPPNGRSAAENIYHDLLTSLGFEK